MSQFNGGCDCSISESNIFTNSAINIKLSTEVIQVNLLSVMHGTKLAVDRLSDGGLVINVASVAGLLPAPPIPAYSASKAAIINYTRYFITLGLKTLCHFNPLKLPRFVHFLMFFYVKIKGSIKMAQIDDSKEPEL